MKSVGSARHQFNVSVAWYHIFWLRLFYANSEHKQRDPCFLLALPLFAPATWQNSFINIMSTLTVEVE